MLKQINSFAETSTEASQLKEHVTYLLNLLRVMRAQIKGVAEKHEMFAQQAIPYSDFIKDLSKITDQTKNNFFKIIKYSLAKTITNLKASGQVL